MCDTLVALGNATYDGAVLFAKNSDREPNEAHEIMIIPAADHPQGSQVTCTYVRIPQVAHTYAVLLAKPFWIWGAEMGANEHGVVIGNEAVFTKIPYEKTDGLIGMDFIRLALERARSAGEAMQCIINLLEQYGQGGNCGFAHPFYYHNSFLIADGGSAWVLETAGKFWVAEQVKDVRTISNALSIGAEWDLACADLVRFAVEKGWCKSRDDFHFARCYSDFLYTRLSDAHSRRACSSEQLLNEKGKITVRSMFSALRRHAPMGKPARRIDRGLIGAEVCMHAGFGPVRASQSVGSMVSRISVTGATHWLTGTSAPCLSVFKPVWMDSGLPDPGVNLTGTFDEKTLFWRHEMLHREVLRNYPLRSQVLISERDILEDAFISEETRLRELHPASRRNFTLKCFQLAQDAERGWLEKVRQLPEERRDALYALAWQKFNREANYVPPPK
ncbi:MAG: C69 family dipeptidase [Chloroflexota bacterium]